MEPQACNQERCDPQPVGQHYTPNYQIMISTLNYGYIVDVGCQRFAIEDVESLISKLSAYLRNPQEAVVRWDQFKTLPE